MLFIFCVEVWFIVWRIEFPAIAGKIAERLLRAGFEGSVVSTVPYTASDAVNSCTLKLYINVYCFIFLVK
jgi:hypothetical protein